MSLRKPRILMIGTLPPPIHGSAMMMQYIYDSKSINSQYDCDYVNLSTSRRLNEIGKKPLLKAIRAFGIYCNVLRYFLFHRYDLCYMAVTCHGIGFLKDMPVMLLARLFCKKRVIHQHNRGMSDCIDKKPYNRLIPFCYKGAKVLLLSWRLYPDIEKVVKKVDVMICPNGIPSIHIEESNPERHNEIPNILFLSNLIPDKGVLVLLDALKVLIEKGYIFKCVFVGGETKEIDAARFDWEVNSRKLNGVVVYNGRIYGSEKEGYWSRADIFVFPTFYRNETFGLVNLEAMQHKIPVVTTDVGGVPDVVDDGKTGIICKQNDVHSLVDALATLINNPALRLQMGEAGFKKYNAQFTISRFEERMVNILNLWLK